MGIAVHADSLGVGDLYHFCESYGSARELLDDLLDSALFRPERVTDSLGTGKKHFIFRGHADVRWELVPTAHRGALAASIVAQRAPQPV